MLGDLYLISEFLKYVVRIRREDRTSWKLLVDNFLKEKFNDLVRIRREVKTSWKLHVDNYLKEKFNDLACGWTRLFVSCLHLPTAPI